MEYLFSDLKEEEKEKEDQEALEFEFLLNGRSEEEIA